MLGKRGTYSAMLKDRDYDVTPHIILILSLTLTQNARGVGERLRGVVWRWSAKSARAHRSCWPRRSYLAHVKASYLLRVRNLELRVPPVENCDFFTFDL